MPTSALWFDRRGNGDPLVLLHPGGAGVDARALTPQVEYFADRFEVFTPEQRAHGRTADLEGPLSYSLMADDTVDFIQSVVGRPVRLLGCSDGAVVALATTLRRPDLVERLVLVAGVHHWNGWDAGVLDGEPPEFLRTAYGDLSPDGPEHYDVVVEKLAAMHAVEPSFGPEDLARVQPRTLVMIGDDDEVRFEHAIEAYTHIPDAELAVVPGTSHGLLVEKPELCNRIIDEFLSRDAVETFAPRRRSGR
ncbi:MAG: alpha/beta hydrolase [Nocardioides sp.]|nr:alpha/beta hydrolase [Nocardioides sp.]